MSDNLTDEDEVLFRQIHMSDRLTDEAEVLFRQIHPNFIESGEPSSDRFRPSEKDKNQLSVDRSSISTAAESHALYTKTGSASAAVYGVSVGEFEAETIGCVSDPVSATGKELGNPAHALANYSTHTAKNQKVVALRLKRLAISRGRLHPTPDVI